MKYISAMQLDPQWEDRTWTGLLWMVFTRLYACKNYHTGYNKAPGFAGINARPK